MRGRYDTWPPEEVEELKALWQQEGGRVQRIAKIMGRTKGQISGKSRILHLHFDGARGPSHALPRLHPAAVAGRSIFTTRTLEPTRDVLKSGDNQRKLGKTVLKGPWKGMPIYSLTLEERATCPRSCQQWLSCYGNSMGLAKRYEAGPELTYQLKAQLAFLDRRHDQGFVVRLHILGDFYSTGYVKFWERALDTFHGLHVFGYTARQHDDPIGAAVAKLRDERWDRFAVRTSGAMHGPRTLVMENADTRLLKNANRIICPAQTGATSHCGNCALCWGAGGQRQANSVFEALMRSSTSFQPGLRAEAIAAGQPLYFTGLPCVRGHIDDRHSASGKCASCRKEDNQKFPAAWREKNRARHLELCQKWHRENRERHIESVRIWRNNNRGALRASRRDHYARNRPRILGWYRNRRAQKIGAAGTHTAADIDAIRLLQKGRCAYCRCSLKYSGEHVDHITPLARGGSNLPRNLQLLCPKCNQSKGAVDPVDYVRRIGRLI